MARVGSWEGEGMGDVCVCVYVYIYVYVNGLYLFVMLKLPTLFPLFIRPSVDYPKGSW